MKNFNFFEKLWEHGRTLRRVGLVLVMCLITITQAWADDRGFWTTEGAYVRFYRNNTYQYECTLNGSGVSDYDLGNIDSDGGLIFTDLWAKVWGGKDIFSKITFRYRVKVQDSDPGADNYSEYDLNFDNEFQNDKKEWNQYWNQTMLSVTLPTTGLAAGNYEVEFQYRGYGKDVKTYWLSNNSGNYHANFTLRRKITYHTDGSTGGSAPSVEWFNSATATVKDNTGLLVKTGKVFAGWATSSDRATDGTIDYAPGATFTITEDVDLYPVWTNGSYLFSLVGSESNGTLNETDFITRGTGGVTNNSAQTINGVTFSKSYYTTSGNQTSIKQQYSNPGNFLVYDTKSTNTTIKVYVKNTHSSAATLYYYLAKEGSTSESDQTESLVAGEAKVINIDASNSKGTRFILCNNQYSKVFITQIIAIESGTTLPLPGETGYELAFPGRVASHFKTINGIEVAGESSNLKWNYDVELRLQSGSSKYVKFTTPASPSQMLLTTLSGKGGYVCTDKNNPSTTGFYFPSVSKTTEHKINLSASTTYYIMGETSSNTCISKIAFTDATTITYDANEGSGSMGSSKNIVSSNSFTPPSGKTFVNWNTKANGTGTPYAPGDYAYSDVKLYAQWGYALTYDKNTTDEVTNMPTSPVGVKAGSMNLASEVPVRSGYIFVGWQVGGSGTIYQPGASYTMPSSATTLKANWVAVDMYISDARKKTWSSEISSGTEITNSNIQGSISGGTVVCSNSSGTLGGNDNYGIVFDNNNDQITITVTGLNFVPGSVIEIGAKGRDNTSSHECGFVVSGEAPTPATVTSSDKANDFRQVYIVTASDGIDGTSSFTLARSTSEKVYLYTLYVGGCEEPSCTTPTIGSQPSNVSICPGSTTTLTVGSITGGNTPYTYQWYDASNDAAMSTGSGYATASFTTPTLNAAASYYCIVTENGGCTTQSNTAAVSMKTDVSITTQPSDVDDAVVGSASTLTIVAAGTSPTYQWYTCDDDKKTNAVAISSGSNASAITDELSITPASVGVTYYYCVVSGCGGPLTSDVVSITAKNQPTQYTVSGTASICSGSNTNITLSNSETGVSYQLYKDGVADGDPEDGSTGDAIVWTVSAAGTYTVKAEESSTYWERAMSGSATVSFKTATSISTQPATAVDAVVDEEFTLGSALVAAGDGTLQYQWFSYSNAAGTADETSVRSASTTKTFSVTKTSAGTYYYRVKVIGGCGTVASNVITITVSACSPTRLAKVTITGGSSSYTVTDSATAIASTHNLQKVEGVGGKLGGSGYLQITPKTSLQSGDKVAVSIRVLDYSQDRLYMRLGRTTSKDTMSIYTGNVKDKDTTLVFTMTGDVDTISFTRATGKASGSTEQNHILKSVIITRPCASSGYTITNAAPDHGTIAITDGSSAITAADEDATVHIEATPADGYSFAGWTVTDEDEGTVEVATSTTTNPTTFSMPAKAVTVNASFTPNTYDITYHLNGASWASAYSAPAEYTVGTGATLPIAANMTNTGYTFGGWFADDDLKTGGVKTEVGTSEYGNKEFWAKWTENTYTITYDKNGGTGDAMSNTVGHYVTLSANTYTKSGFVFAGWNTASGGDGDSYGEGDEIELTGNMTLYAIWATGYDISWGNVQYGGADETPNLGGGNYTITASVATWTGTLTTDMISAVSDGVTITNVAVNNSATPKAITATFDVGASVAGTTIKMQLDVPAYGVYGAKSSEKSITIDRCSGGGSASTVVFSQNFSSDGAGSVAYAANTAREYKSGGTTITGIVGSGTNEFTYIGQAQKDKCGVAVNSSTGGNSVNATGMFQAYCNNTGGKYALVKNSDFAATAPTALKVSMKIWFQQGSSGSDYSVTFAVGDGFSNSTSAPDASNVHSGFSIINNSNAYLYAYKSNKTALSGTNKLTQGSDLTMVWVINNSGQTLSYTDPASNTSTLANDKFDVWIGTTRFIAGANATTASKALQDLYIGDPAGKNHQLRLDDIVVTDISPAVSSITPTLTWDDGALDIASVGVTKEEGDADFTFTASQNKNSLGAITYSSSNTSVATVNASGKVHIVGNGSTTITASIAESGCYKDADVSYSLTVNEKACADAAGTIKDNDGNTIDGNAITKSSCETVTLKLVGYTDDADIQWYKDGEEIDGAIAASYTVPTSGSGVYSAISSKTCDRNSTNEITVTNSASVSATKIVDSWYVKAGRRTPDIALVQTMDAASFQVKISSTVIWSTVSGSEVTTGLGGCGFYLGKDGIIYLKGTKSNGNATDDILENKTLSFVVTNACGTNASDPGNITIKRQAATDRPSVAYVSLGTKGGVVTDTTAGYYKTAALYKYLDNNFDLTASNVYWSVNEKELKEHYSQFDAILITDDPSTKTVPSGVSGDGAYKTKGYVNALGCLVDIRPILTMEAYVSALANWKTKGINGDPTSPNPRQYSMKLQCKDHEIFGSLSVGDNVVQTTVDGTNYWSVKMVDNTKSPYSGLADDEKTSGKGSIPALQGFAASDVSGLLLLGQISDGAYHAGVERQEEPAARLMLLGLNNQALPNALTQEGKIVIKNALTYLLKTNMEEVDDCSNYFTGATSTDWNTPSNWFKGVVPNSPMVRARILAPCEITGITVKAAQIDIVTSGTSSKKAGELTGKLTINPTGALIVGGKIRAAEAPYFSIEDLKPTEEEDLVLNTNSSNQAALIFDNEDGDTKATVNLYSLGRKESDTYQFQYYAVPMDYVSVSESFAGSDIYTYVWHEATGWERRGYYTDLYAFEGVGITTKLAAPKTYTMKGALASTATKEITLTNSTKGGLNLIGNSWTAPIQIGSLAEDNADANITETVYIYYTGNDGGSAHSGTTEAAGQWLAIPFEAAKFEKWEGLKVIPAMQAFEIKVTEEATLTLDYNKLVRGSTNDLNAKLRAPRRNEVAETTLSLIRVSDSKTHTDLSLFESERFSEAFDNGWEAELKEGNGWSATLYAETETGHMAVAAMEDYEGTIVGFKPGTESEYTYSFIGADNGYYLNDLKTHRSVRISEGETYTFTTEEGDAVSRFYISRTAIDAQEIATGVTDLDAEAPKVQKVIYNDKLFIIRGGKVYSAEGQLVK